MEISQKIDPYTQASFPLANRLARAAWGVVQATLFRLSPRPLHAWRAFLLRCFGARLGRSCYVYPRARIWAPWNLVCEDVATVGDEAVVYNPQQVHLGSHAIVSQQAYLCGATHDCDDAGFRLIAAPISIGPYAWICARAVVQPGVTVAEGAVLGLGGIATKDLEPWTVYGGVPARRIRKRRRPAAGRAALEQERTPV